MIDFSLLFLFQNIIILSLIFWALSFAGKESFRLKSFKVSLELFECGFLSSTKFNMQFNLNFLIVIWLLIIYDAEFFFLVPYLFNWSYVNLTCLFVFIIFLILVYLTIIYDYQSIYLNYYL